MMSHSSSVFDKLNNNDKETITNFQRRVTDSRTIQSAQPSQRSSERMMMMLMNPDIVRITHTAAKPMVLQASSVGATNAVTSSFTNSYERMSGYSGDNMIVGGGQISTLMLQQ